jgi:hypothetical protein
VFIGFHFRVFQELSNSPVGCSKSRQERTDVAFWNGLIKALAQGELFGIDMNSASAYNCLEWFNERGFCLQYVVVKGVVHGSNVPKNLRDIAATNSAQWAMKFCNEAVPHMSPLRMFRLQTQRVCVLKFVCAEAGKFFPTMKIVLKSDFCSNLSIWLYRQTCRCGKLT